VIPAHLTELSPDEIRGFYPGVTYQLGNLFAALNLPLQTAIAGHFNKQYGLGLAVVIGPVLLLTAIVTILGPENKGARFGEITSVDQRPRASPASLPSAATT
jgi:SHS family lactate transporter-like MFS transporter